MAYLERPGNRLMVFTPWFGFCLEELSPDLNTLRYRTGYWIGWGRMPRVGGGQMYRHFIEDWVYTNV